MSYPNQASGTSQIFLSFRFQPNCFSTAQNNQKISPVTIEITHEFVIWIHQHLWSQRHIMLSEGKNKRVYSSNLLPSKKTNIHNLVMIVWGKVLLALLATHNLKMICVRKMPWSTMVSEAWSCNQSMRLFHLCPRIFWPMKRPIGHLRCWIRLSRDCAFSIFYSFYDNIHHLHMMDFLFIN